MPEKTGEKKEMQDAILQHSTGQLVPGKLENAAATERDRYSRIDLEIHIKMVMDSTVIKTAKTVTYPFRLTPIHIRKWEAFICDYISMAGKDTDTPHF